MAKALPGPSHSYYTTDDVLQMLEDVGYEDSELNDVDMNEPVCDGSNDDLELEAAEHEVRNDSNTQYK